MNKSKKSPRLSTVAVAVVAACTFPAGALMAQSLPTGGNVVAGQATISQPTASSMLINQSTQKAALDWTSFSIGAGNSVVFQQPSVSSIALNRVTGGSASNIYGSLSANGQVFLVNPSGVLFAPGASVNAGGLVASTLDISASDFMLGNFSFANSGGAGSVINRGVINTSGGYVALMGPNVSNEGVINARLGSVALAAGNQVSLDMVGDGLISVRVDQAALNASVVNSGSINADGGSVMLTARSANALLDTVINTSGVIRANSIAERNGKIYLDGGSAGVTSVSGTLSASGLGAGEKGGGVTVLGQYVGLFDGANVNASGDSGGGTVLVGGNFQGKGPESNALRTYVASGATINADAVTSGNGGKVIVWADDVTRYYGSISARGGATGGDGGFAEVSGKGSLLFEGQANLSAANGKAGTLLLDPDVIQIVSTVQTNPADSASNEFADNAAGTTLLEAADIATVMSVNGTNVVLQANTDILVQTNLTVGNVGSTNENLTLRAGRHIIFATAPDVSDPTASTGSVAVSVLDGALAMTFNDPGDANTVANRDAGSAQLFMVTGSSLTATAGISVTGGAGVAGAAAIGAANLRAMSAGTGVGLVFNSDGAINVTGIIAGTTLTKQGSGTLTLSGANTYVGLTDVQAGVLNLQHNTASGTIAGGVTVASGARLELQGGITVGDENLSIAGTGGGAGALLNVSGDNTWGGTVTLTANATIGSTLGTITLSNANSVNDASDQTLTFAGASNGLISGTITTGSGGLTKTGDGVLTLAGANTYDGVTTINQGVLSVSSLANGTNASNLGDADATVASNLVLNGGTLRYTGNVAVSTDRLFTLGASGGTIDASGSIAASALTFSNTGAIATTGPGTRTLTLTTGGTNNGANVFAPSLANENTNATSLTKSGGGIWVLTNTGNAYTGATTVSAGTLRLGAAGVIADTSALVVNGTFDLAGFDEAVGSLAGSGTVTNSGGPATTQTLSAGDTSETVFSGVMQNGATAALALTKTGTGTLVLSGNNSYSGGTTVSLGTLAIDNTVAGADAGSGAINLGANSLDLRNTALVGTGSLTNILGGATIASSTGNGTLSGNLTLPATNLNLSAGSGSTLSVTGNLSGGGNGLTKLGLGTVTLSGNNTYTGATVVNNGTLVAASATALGSNSNVTVNDTVADANPATLGVNPALTVAIGSLTLGGAGGTSTSVSNVTLGAGSTLELGGNVTFDATGNPLGSTISGGAVDLNGASRSFVVQASSNASTGLTVGSVIQHGSVGDAVIKDAGGTLLLQGANTYDGQTIVNNGVLAFTSIQDRNSGIPSALGEPSTVPRATIDVSGTGTLRYVGGGHSSDRDINLTGSGATIDASGSGLLTLSGAVMGGAVNLVLAGDVPGTGLLSGAIATNGGLTKNGSGTWTLTAINTYTGATTVTAGKLTVDGLGANLGNLSATSAININGGTFELNDADVTSFGPVSLNGGALSILGTSNSLGGAITLNDNSTINVGTGATFGLGGLGGAFSLTKDGAGTFNLGTSTYTGDTTVSGGTMNLTGGFANGGILIVQGGSTFNLGDGPTTRTFNEVRLIDGAISNTSVVTPGTLTSLATFDVRNGTISAPLLGTVGLTKTLGGEVILSGANSYSGTTTVSGGTLALSGGLAIANTGVVVLDTATATLKLNGSETIGSLAGVASTAVNLQGNTLTTGGLNTPTTFAGDISGVGGGLTKVGTGTFTLSGANTYSGTTFINNGILEATTNGGALGTSAVRLNGGTLNINNMTLGGVTTMFIQPGQGNGFGGNGSLTGTGTAAYNGPIQMDNSENFRVGVGGADTLTLGGAMQWTTLGVGVWDVNVDKVGTGNLVLTGNSLLGTGFLTESTVSISAGTLTLSGPTVRVADGLITVGANTLNINAGANILNAVTVAGGTIGNTAGAGTLSVGGLTLLADSNLSSSLTGTGLTVSAVVSGGFGIAKVGTGGVTLSGANTYTGATSINAGTLFASGGFAIPDLSSVVMGGGTLDLNASETVGSLAGTSNVVLDGFTLTVGGNGTSTAYSGVASGTGGITKVGAGTMTLSGANSYTGATTVSAGQLALGASGVLADTSTVVVNGGTLNIASNSDTVAGVQMTAGSIIGTTGVLSSTTAFDMQAGTVTAILGGASGLTKTTGGLVTLSGANTYTGATTVTAGELALGASNVLADTSTVVVNGGTLNVAGFSDTVAGVQMTSGSITGTTGVLTSTTAFDMQAGTVTAILGGTSGLTKTTAGLVTLSGANTYTGATTVTAGELALGASNVLADTSTVVVNGGTLNIAGNSDTVAGVQLASGSITGTTGVLTSTTNFDMQAGTVSAILGGTVGLTKTTDGNVTLSGANTYTGTTTINSATVAGKLILSGGAAIANPTGAVDSTGDVNLVSGTLQIDASTETIGSLTGAAGTVITLNTGIFPNNGLSFGDESSTIIASAIGGGGALDKVGAGTVTLSGNNLGHGYTDINAGAIIAAHNNALGDTPVTGSTGFTRLLTGGELIIQGGVQLNAAPAIFANFGGTIRSTVGAAGYDGLIHINNGNVLTIGVASGGTLTLGGQIQVFGGSPTSSSVNKVDLGTAVFTSAKQYTGGTTISGGTLSVSGVGTTAGSGAITVGTNTLDIANGADVTNAVSIAGGAITNSAGSGTLSTGGMSLLADSTLSSVGAGLLVSANISGVGGITKAGAGTVTLSGNNTYSGPTNVNAGSLIGNGGFAIGDTSAVMMSGGTLTLSTAETIGSLAGTANVTLGGTLTTGGDGTSTAYSGVLGGTGGLTKVGAGSMTISGANTNVGATTVSAGTLTANGGAAIGDTSAVTVDAGAALVLGAAETVGSLAGAGNVTLGGTLTSGGDNSNTVFSGVLSGAGGLTKAGTGALLLAGANLYDGVTTIAAGTVVANSATALGSTAGGTTVAGGATLAINGVVIGAEAVSVAGTGVAGNAIAWAGPASLAGAITLTGATVIGGSGAMTFSGGVSGAHSLTVNSAGATTFSAPINIGALTTDIGGTTNLQSVTTSGNQTYNDNIVGLNGIYTTGGGTFTVTNAAALTGNTTVNTTSGAVTIGTVDGVAAGAQSLTVSTSGLTTLGTVGEKNAGAPADSAPSSLTTTGGGNVLLLGNVTTQGAQSYSGNTTFSGAFYDTTNFTTAAGANFAVGGTSTFTGASRIIAGTGNVGFNGALHGPGSVRVSTSGTTTFAANIGATTPLDSIRVNGGSVVLPSSITTNGGMGNIQQGQVFNSIATLGAGSITFNAASNQFVFLPNVGNNFGGSPVTVTNGSVVFIRDSAPQFVIGGAGMTASNSINLEVAQYQSTPLVSVAQATELGVTGPDLAPTLNAPFVSLKFNVDYPSPPHLRDTTNFTNVALYHLGTSVMGIEVRPPSVEAAMGVPFPKADMVEGYRFYFTGQVPTGGSLSYTDPVTNLPVSASALSFRNIDLRVNNIGVNPAFDGPDQALTSAITAAQQAAAQAAQEEAKKSFGTDSVREQIERGFAGDVGTSPPMDHRIVNVGISVPACFDESREGQACK